MIQNLQNIKINQTLADMQKKRIKTTGNGIVFCQVGNASIGRRIVRHDQPMFYTH